MFARVHALTHRGAVAPFSAEGGQLQVPGSMREPRPRQVSRPITLSSVIDFSSYVVPRHSMR
jgi:hypothetical protein